MGCFSDIINVCVYSFNAFLPCPQRKASRSVGSYRTLFAHQFVKPKPISQETCQIIKWCVSGAEFFVDLCRLANAGSHEAPIYARERHRRMGLDTSIEIYPRVFKLYLILSGVPVNRLMSHRMLVAIIAKRHPWTAG